MQGAGETFCIFATKEHKDHKGSVSRRDAKAQIFCHSERSEKSPVCITAYSILIPQRVGGNALHLGIGVTGLASEALAKEGGRALPAQGFLCVLFSFAIFALKSVSVPLRRTKQKRARLGRV
jgi:hypothetical protein